MTASTRQALEIRPTETSSERDFDFLHGTWTVQNRKLQLRLTNCDDWDEFVTHCECGPILLGFGNQEFFTATLESGPFEATTVRLFNPKTRLWSLYWADSRSVTMEVAQVGSFDGSVGEFLARDVWEGKPVLVKFRWDQTNRVNPSWSQAFSEDEGKTWEWNWYMDFSRAG